MLLLLLLVRSHTGDFRKCQQQLSLSFVRPAVGRKLAAVNLAKQLTPRAARVKDNDGKAGKTLELGWVLSYVKLRRAADKGADNDNNNQQQHQK